MKQPAITTLVLLATFSLAVLPVQAMQPSKTGSAGLTKTSTTGSSTGSGQTGVSTQQPSTGSGSTQPQIQTISRQQGDAPATTTNGAVLENATDSDETASGQATGKRTHKPAKVKTYDFDGAED